MATGPPVEFQPPSIRGPSQDRLVFHLHFHKSSKRRKGPPNSEKPPLALLLRVFPYFVFLHFFLIRSRIINSRFQPSVRFMSKHIRFHPVLFFSLLFFWFAFYFFHSPVTPPPFLNCVNAQKKPWTRGLCLAPSPPKSYNDWRIPRRRPASTMHLVLVRKNPYFLYFRRDPTLDYTSFGFQRPLSRRPAASAAFCFCFGHHINPPFVDIDLPIPLKNLGRPPTLATA